MVGLASSYDLCLYRTTVSPKTQTPLKKKAPALTLPQACLLMKVALPMKPFDIKRAIRLIGYYQKRNYIAYESHKKSKEGKFQNLAL